MSSIQTHVKCRCGEEHEIYEGFRKCPIFQSQIEIASRKSGHAPKHLLSTGKWKEINIDGTELGLGHEQ